MSNFFKNIEQPLNLLDTQAFEANRRGEITTAQQKQLATAVNWWRIIVLAITMIMISSMLGLAFIPALLRGNPYKNLPATLPVGGIFLAVLLFMGYSVLYQASKAIKIRRDLASRAIVHGQGQLTHDKQGYGFEMNGKRLYLPANLANGLLPGIPYQVYYLEESGVLVSAAATYQAAPAQTRTALNEILASANRFSADDLLANKSGEVTFTQRSKLLPKIIVGLVILLGCLIVLITFVLVPAFSGQKISTALLVVILLIALFTLVGIALMIKPLLDAVSPKLQQVQGLVVKGYRVVNTGRSSHTEYFYTINSQRFTVDYRAYTALIDGLQYRIYYLPRSKKLIAIEALDGLPDGARF